MKKTGFLLVAFLILLSHFINADPAKTLPDEVERLVRQLGTADMKVRDKAFQRLLDLGAKTPREILILIPQNDADPEIAVRCEELRRRIPWEPCRRSAERIAGSDPQLRKIFETLFDVSRPLRERLDGLDYANHRENTAQMVAVFLRCPEPNECGVAAEMLAEMAEKSVIEEIRLLLREKDPELRWIGIYAIGCWGEAFADEIAPFLDDPDSKVQRATASWLMMIFKQEGWHKNDPDLIEKAKMFCKERQKRTSDWTTLLKQDPWKSRQLCALRLVSAYPEFKEAVEHLYAGPSAETFCEFANISGMKFHGISRKDSAWILIDFLEHPSSEVQAAAAETLSAFLDASVADETVTVLGHSNPSVRVNAVRSLANPKAKHVAVEIEKLLRDPIPDVRSAAIFALGRIDGKSFAPKLVEGLSDPKPEVRQCAIEALMIAALEGRVEAKEYSLVVAKMLLDPDRGVQKASLEFLRGCEDTSRAIVIVPQLTKFLESDEDEIRDFGSDCLFVLIKERKHAPLLAKLLEHPRTEIQSDVAYLLNRLLNQSWISGPEGVILARAWWESHKNDPEFKLQK